MPIHQKEQETKQGPLDAVRHREKQREAIKKGVRDIIADESIITRGREEKIKVPIRGIKSYKFKHGSPDGEGYGLGQGEGQPGDVIGKKPGKGRPGKAGDEPGEDFIESEIELSEVIEYMLEDMGLPKLETKEVAKLVTPEGWSFKDISKTGLRPNLEKKRTLQEGMKRLIHFIEELKRETGCSEEECEHALEIAEGDLNEAISILRKGELPAELIKASPVITSDDMRFRSMEESEEYHSNAVVIAMMDVSASMGLEKKFVARSFFFWLVEVLRHLYENVEIRFISHTTKAKVVDEHHFFHKGESGGTMCHSAFDLASELVEKEYPTSKFNVYAFLFSDGDDFHPEITVKSVRRLANLGVNMIGYGEIMESNAMSQLMRHLEHGFDLKTVVSLAKEEGMIVLEAPRHAFVSVLIKDEKDILSALHEFLRKERWQ